ncbi:MAG: ornithine carbamoyltransferase [Patescibacteria group bacterium]
MRHFLRITDVTRKELDEIFALSRKLKKEIKKSDHHKKLPFLNKTLAAIYEKPSLRTRISFEVGMTQLGGHAIYLGPTDIQMGARESANDIGIVTSSMVDMIMARTFKHTTVQELANGSSVPVINGLSDLEHPCQVLADYLTIDEEFGKLTGLKVCFVGDGNNNVTHSLALISALLGNHFAVASPKGFTMNPQIVAEFQALAKKSKAKLTQTQDVQEAAENADVIVADTWVSMGAEAEKEKRLKIFKSYQVDSSVMKLAKKKAIFLHCLPAYRGKEVSAEVIDGPQSRIYPEAENRLHAQKGLMVWLAKNN